jgi:peptidyl-tRNA hydrolase, PTH1 family
VAPEHRVTDGKDYLLSPFRKSQVTAVSEMLDAAAEAVMMVLTEGEGPAMNRFNRKDKEVDPES